MKNLILIFSIIIFSSCSQQQGSKTDSINLTAKSIKIFTPTDTISATGEFEMITNTPTKKEHKWLDYLIPILLGLFAGLIALYQIKLNNITAAKIKWVERYRDVLSHYLTNVDSSAIHLVNICHIKEKESKKGKKSKRYYEFYEKYSTCADLATHYYFQLKVLLYKNNDEFKNLEKLLDELDSLYGEVKTDKEIKALRKKIESFITSSQQTLGNEWKLIEKRNYKT
nr:hypothetical protein [uncultured Draconibacterium sp.]